MLIIFAVLCTAYAAQHDATALLHRLQQTYHIKQDVNAHFEQTYSDALRGSTRVEHGDVWVAKDGRVRWRYNAPIMKDFIFDGHTAYFYEPDNNQVTVFENFHDSPVATVMSCVWGHGDFLQLFNVVDCDATCPDVQAPIYAVKLLPKETMASVQYVILLIQQNSTGKNVALQSTMVVDPLGNQTTYAFKHLRMTKKIDATQFVFHIPDGVSVMRAVMAP